MARVHIGLGSNLAEPRQQLRSAVTALAALPNSRLEACSSLYRSPPMGPADQPDYLNAVVRLRTELAPLALLDRLQAIEAAQGRIRGGLRWGARTLDLDLLLWEARQIDEARLQVPHPGLHLRAFVLYPLAEIDPQLDVPGRGALAELLAGCARGGLERIAAPPQWDQ